MTVPTPAGPGDPFIGRTVGGKYVLVGLLGRGGFGAVYRARQESVGRDVAVKLITPPAGNDRLKLQERFEQEAAVVARLKHPNTVTLFDFGVEPDGSLFMVLELVGGVTLSQVIKESAPLSPRRTAHIIGSVLDALVEAHALGLVHRDLKPANIMLGQSAWGDEVVKVLDFGIAKVATSDRQADLTETGQVFGTPKYMAPEQVTSDPVDGRTDLYALGVLTYECLAGVPPFDAENSFTLMLKQKDEPTPPLDPSLNVPVAMSKVIEAAMEKDPAERFADARTMASALRVCVAGRASTPSEMVAMSNPSLEALAANPTGRRFLSALPILAILLLAGLLSWFAGDTGDATPPLAASQVTDEPASGDEMVDEGKVDAALMALEAAVDEAPSDSAPRLRLARLHASRTNTPDAIAALEAYLSLEPDIAALAATIATDDAFDAVRAQEDFARWAVRRRLIQSPGAPRVNSARRDPTSSTGATTPVRRRAPATPRPSEPAENEADDNEEDAKRLNIPEF